MKNKRFIIGTLLGLSILAACGQNGGGGAVVTATPTPGPLIVTATPTPGEVHDSDTPEVTMSIKELFATHGMKAGTCLSPQMISNLKYSQFIVENFNSITLENDLKPDYLFNKAKSIQKGELVVELNANAIKELDWAKKNNMAVRGHTLVWYSQTPEWIFHVDFDEKKELVGREEMLARLESYMSQLFALLTEKGYAEIIYAYDVVNEAWMENGTLRQNNWIATIGEDYMVETFKLAKKYAPAHIDLYYNDYNEQFKTSALLKFIETLKDEAGNPTIDGIGFQAHLYTSDDLKAYFRHMDSIAATGLKIQLTELDVELGKYNGLLDPTDANLKTQGRYYYDLISGIFERVDSGKINSDALTFWGFNDGLSWRKEGSPLLVTGLNNNPKYAYYGVLQIKEKAGFE